MLNVFAAHRTIHRAYFEHEVRAARLLWFLLDELREKRSARRFAIASSCLEVSRCNEKRFAAAVHGPKERDAPCSAMLDRTSISLVAKSPTNETFVRLYRVCYRSRLLYLLGKTRAMHRSLFTIIIIKLITGKARSLSADIPRITCESAIRGYLTRILDIIRSSRREGVATLGGFGWRIGSLYSKWSGPLHKLSCFHEDGKREWPFEGKRNSPTIRVIDGSRSRYKNG